jgi:hypothetical protein
MCVEHPSADGAETVLVSRNVPLGDEKPTPSILKAKDDIKEIQIENEDDWAVPADEENEDVQPMEEDIPANEQAKPAHDAMPAQQSLPQNSGAQPKSAEDTPMNGVAQPSLENGTDGNLRGEELADASAQSEKPDATNASNAENVRLSSDCSRYRTASAVMSLQYGIKSTDGLQC